VEKLGLRWLGWVWFGLGCLGRGGECVTWVCRGEENVDEDGGSCSYGLLLVLGYFCLGILRVMKNHAQRRTETYDTKKPERDYGIRCDGTSSSAS
jgi:hypothetical protein